MKLGEFTLKAFQEEAVAKTRAELARLRDAGLPKRTILYLPTGCVSGDTLLHINRASKGYSRTIADAFRLQFDKRNSGVIGTRVRSFIGNRIGLNDVEGITYSGEKSVVRILLGNGRSLKATPDHEILTENGFCTIDELSGTSRIICEGRLRQTPKAARLSYLQVQGLIFHPFAGRAQAFRKRGNHVEGRLFRVPLHRLVMESHLNGLDTDVFIWMCRNDPEICSKLTYLDPSIYAVHHKDRNPHNNELDNLEILTHSDHGVVHGRNENILNFPRNDIHHSMLVSSVKCGTESTYDIVCRGGYRNFVANGIVVHNSGKTVCSCAIMRLALDKGKRCAFLASGRILISQKSARLTQCGINHKVLMADADPFPMYECSDAGRVLVASKDTLYARKIAIDTDLVIVDECVAGSTMIHTEIGHIPISRARKAKFVMAHNGNTAIYSRVLRWIFRGIRNTIKISLDDGSTLSCTPEHRLMSDSGWVYARDLRKGNSLCCASVDAVKLRELMIKGDSASGLTATIGREKRRSPSGENNSTHWSIQHQSAHVDADYLSCYKSRTLTRSFGCVDHQDTIDSCSDIKIGHHVGTLKSEQFTKRQSWEHCSETSVLDIQTQAPSLHEFTEIMEASNFCGLSTNVIFCLVSDALSPTPKTGGMEKRMCVLDQRPALHSFQYSKLVNLEGAKSKLTRDGSTPSETSVSLGGYATMDQHHKESAFVCTLRDTRRRRTNSFVNGSVKNSDVQELLDTGDTATSRFTPKADLKLDAEFASISPSACHIRFLRVTAITENQSEEVFDLEVEGCHSYFANGILSHNCHLSISDAWQKILMEADCPVIGLTATPARSDGKGLGQFYSSIVKVTTYDELVLEGSLVACRMVAPFTVHINGTPTSHGDWSAQQNERAFNHRVLVGQVVDNWIKWGENRPTFVYAMTVDHARSLCEDFNGKGIMASLVHAHSTDEERATAYRRFDEGLDRVICNVGVLAVGADFPRASCGVLAFCTQSVVKFRQVAGRFFRTYPGKSDGLLIDHGGNYERHGWPQDEVAWTLDGRATEANESDSKDETYVPRKTSFCPRCNEVWRRGAKCPKCGYIPRGRSQSKLIEVVDGELHEVKRLKPKKRKEYTDEQKAWRSSIGQAANRNMTARQAKILFKAKMGYWPRNTLSPWADDHQWDWKAADLWPNYVRGKRPVRQLGD